MLALLGSFILLPTLILLDNPRKLIGRTFVASGLLVFFVSIFMNADDSRFHYSQHPDKVVDEVWTSREVNGVVINVPAKGDQCWETPLPCTPYPNENLERRQVGNYTMFILP